MTFEYAPVRATRKETRERAKTEYRVIYALSFIFFLAAVLLARFGRLLRAPFSATRRSGKSLLAETRDAANSTLPFAFMG